MSTKRVRRGVEWLATVSLRAPAKATEKDISIWVGRTLRDAGQEMEPLYDTAKHIKVEKVERR